MIYTGPGNQNTAQQSKPIFRAIYKIYSDTSDTMDLFGQRTFAVMMWQKASHS